MNTKRKPYACMYSLPILRNNKRQIIIYLYIYKMQKDEIKIRRKWTWKVKQWETTRNVKSEPDVRLIYKMRSEIFHHLELFSQLTRRKERRT